MYNLWFLSILGSKYPFHEFCDNLTYILNENIKMAAVVLANEK